ncbi:ABC transporter permease [Candidatus Margulisiibacteriota bacterium]
MIAIKLALRNLLGAGLRTWLNVIVLSFSYVLIIWTQGFYLGMYDQAKYFLIKEEVGGGQYWQKNYDPFDPLTLSDSHSVIPTKLAKLIRQKQAVPILVRQASIYPSGRMQNVIMKGIDPNQTLLQFPTSALKNANIELPVLIGTEMAKTTKLKEGDEFTVRWRDAEGTFDALDGTVVKIMKSRSPNIDRGQIWIPLKTMQKITKMPNEATAITIHPELENIPQISGWKFKDLDYFLEDVENFVEAKTAGAGIMYLLLMFLALLAIFDTQVLAVFKRRKEIGTMMAMGLTRAKVIFLFTFEGAIYGILAAILAAIWGLPILAVTAIYGIPLPEISRATISFGVAERMFPTYSLALVLGTTLLILISVTIVSFLPTRKISKLKPTDAIRGKAS